MRALTFKERVLLRDKFSSHNKTREHSSICKPCIVNRHSQCDLDTCCCICNEIETSKAENENLKNYYHTIFRQV